MSILSYYEELDINFNNLNNCFQLRFNGFMSAVENRVLISVHGGSLEITLTVLSIKSHKFKVKQI